VRYSIPEEAAPAALHQKPGPPHRSHPVPRSLAFVTREKPECRAGCSKTLVYSAKLRTCIGNQCIPDAGPRGRRLVKWPPTSLKTEQPSDVIDALSLIKAFRRGDFPIFWKSKCVILKFPVHFLRAISRKIRPNCGARNDERSDDRSRHRPQFFDPTADLGSSAVVMALMSLPPCEIRCFD